MRESVGRRILTDGLGLDGGEHLLETFVQVFLQALLTQEKVGLEDIMEVGGESLGVESLTGFFKFFSLLIVNEVLSTSFKLT